ncbi:MAG TPA: T9SS type A sorting domain-containing protein [Bacteroidia bacterium]|nr:T9SS type A sorting domain-containing protein [Bacteroidia bacterium]
MKTCLFAFLLITGIPQVSSAQNFCHAIGATGFQRGYSVKQTYDNGFVITGTSAGDVYVIKLDSALNVEWEKNINGSGIEAGFSIVQAFDSGYAITGYTRISNVRHLYIIKLDAAGNLLWSNYVGDPWASSGFSIIQSADSGFAVAGFTEAEGTYAFDSYLIKVDKNGNLLWSRTVGGTNPDYAYAVTQTLDGGYVITGLHSFNTIGHNLYVGKFSAAGFFQWGKAYNVTSTPAVGYSIIQLSDSGYVVAGNINGDIYLLHMDPTGQLLSSKAIGGPSAEVATVISKTDPKTVTLIKTNDGGYALATLTYSFGAGGSDIYIVKLDSLFNILWTRTIGGPGYEEAYSIIQTGAGGYAVVGSTTSFGSGSEDVFFALLDSAGIDCCVSGSGGTSTPLTSFFGQSGTSNIGAIMYPSGATSNTSLTTVLACLTCTPPSITLSAPDTSCAGDSITISAFVNGGSGPYRYLWQPGGDTTSTIQIAPNATVTYTLFVVDSVNCDSSKSITVIVNPLPVVNISGFSSICDGQVNTLTASGALVYNWMPGNDTTTVITNYPSASVTYTLTGTDVNGCRDTAVFPLTVNQCPMLASFCFSIVEETGAQARDVIQCTDGNFVIVGFAYSYLDKDVYLVKVAANGYIIWARKFGDAYDDEGYSIAETTDGGFIITGYTEQANTRMLVVKTNNMGIPQWIRTVGVSGKNSSGNDVIQTSDGGYAITGFQQTGSGYDPQLVVVKMNSSGTIVWTRTVGDQYNGDEGYHIIQTTDGGYAVGGETHGFITGWSSAYVVKISSTGVAQWTSVFGGPLDDDARGIVQTNDGGYLTAGNSSNSGCLAKLSNNGTLQWVKTIMYSSSMQQPWSLLKTSDGGFAYLDFNGSIVKLDNNYNFQWALAENLISNSYMLGFIQSSDGGYVFAGSDYYGMSISKVDPWGGSCCFVPDTSFQLVPDTFNIASGGIFGNPGTTNNPVFTIDSGGVLNENCSVITSHDIPLNNETAFSVYPNPSSGKIFIYPGIGNIPYSVTVTNTLGRVIYRGLPQRSEQAIDLHGNSTGIYVVQIQSQEMMHYFKILLH